MLVKIKVKCQNDGCTCVYEVEVSVKGYDFVKKIGALWQCVVCGKWNMIVEGDVKDMGGGG